MEKRGFKPLGYQGAKIPVYDRWTPVERRVGAGRVFLVGDAAGQVKVSTVGGIVTGFRGAIGVSESIVNVLSITFWFPVPTFPNCTSSAV